MLGPGAPVVDRVALRDVPGTPGHSPSSFPPWSLQTFPVLTWPGTCPQSASKLPAPEHRACATRLLPGNVGGVCSQGHVWLPALAPAVRGALRAPALRDPLCEQRLELLSMSRAPPLRRCLGSTGSQGRSYSALAPLEPPVHTLVLLQFSKKLPHGVRALRKSRYGWWHVWVEGARGT